MMRTSASQFEFMVQFMLQHGDLNRPAITGPQGRITASKKWEELTTALNLDATGTSKSVDKWKKVWSDLKNNTKKKYMKIAEKAKDPQSNYGNGPKLALSPLEHKVIRIAGFKRPDLTNGDDVELDVLDQSVESNDSAESTTSDHYEPDHNDIEQFETVHHVPIHHETVEDQPLHHQTVQVEIIDEIKREKVREDSPEFVSEMETNVINETNKLFAKIIEQELVLVPKRRRIECMQEILGVIKKYNN